jgi:multidrug transporter EmrE-like cation transporter
MNGILLVSALFSECLVVISLKLSQGFSKRLAGLAMVAFAVLSLTVLSVALPVKGFAMNVIYAAWSGVGIALIVITELLWKQQEQWNGRGIGPIGTTARLGIGLWLVGSVIHGQLTTGFTPATHTIATWALGLIGFPALALAWHGWRIRRHPARFVDTSLLSFALSVALPLAPYFTWWYAPAFSVTSDAVLLFVGGSMVFAALRGSAGCELLALSNWLLRRCDQIACALLTPIDSLEQRGHTLV